MIVKVNPAKSQPSKLIAAVAAGEQVVIANGDKPAVKVLLADAPAIPKRVFGSLKGKIALTDAFFAPLPDDALALWNGEGD